MENENLDQLKKEAVRLYSLEKSYRVIGKELGRSHTTIKKWIKESGIERRTRSEHVFYLIVNLAESGLDKIPLEDRADFCKRAIVAQLKKDELIPESPPESKPQTRKRKKPAPIAEQA